MPRRFVCAAISILAPALAALALPGSAWAIAPTTHVTSPADRSYLLAEEGRTVKVSGTAAAGVTSVDLRCYWGNEAFDFSSLKAEVAVVGEAFSAELSSLTFYGGVCQVRAVPREVKGPMLPTGLGPGQESEAAQKYAGPLVAPSYYTPEPGNFYATATTFTGSLWFESAGTYAFESELYSTIAHEDVRSFWGELSLPAKALGEARASLRVDGVDAYVPAAALKVEENVKAPIAGIPAPVITKTFDEATRQWTIQDEEQIVRCAPEAAKYPPTKESCKSFVPVGVTLVRNWQSVESRLALLTETWRSTNGEAHNVSARYYNEMHSGAEGLAEGGLYRFPGEAAFAPTHKGEAKTLPAGAGMILYKAGTKVADAGDGVHPQDAWAYDIAPSEPLKVITGSAEPSENAFEIPYQRTIPAGGTATLRMAFAQAFSLGEAASMAEGALASYRPTVAISAPANGSSIVSLNPTVTVSGTAADAVGLSSLTVGGKAVAVGAGGAWSTPLTLAPGANTITAVATNQAGLTASASVSVSYAQPPAAVARVIGSPSGRNGKITLTLACAGVPGQSCRIALSASVLEHLGRGRIRSLSARARTRRVTVAASTVTLQAGQRRTISLGLNRTGRALLARFHKLPVTLKATLAPASTILKRTLTVKPKPPRRRRR